MDGHDVARIEIASTYRGRLVGLLGTRGTTGALLLAPCNGVHGVGMLYPLDIALLDAELAVLRTAVLHRFGLVRPRRGVRYVLEAQRGAFERWGLGQGVRLTLGDELDELS